MTTSVSPHAHGRTVDAVQTPTRTAPGTRFAQAVDRVARIDRPLSPAFDTARNRHEIDGLTASMDESKARLGRLQARMQRTGDARLAPLIATEMQELDYRASLAAKALGKVGSTIKEVVTAS